MVPFDLAQQAAEADPLRGVCAVPNLRIDFFELHNRLCGPEWAERYAGADEPTVIARNASNNKRHLNAANSRLHFQNITFSDGCWRTGSVGGGSLYLSGCTTAMTNCVFAGNKVNYTAGGGNSIADGGAIYASGGSLDLYGCVFTNNANFISSECRTHGGAISAASCGLAAKKCLFVGNYAYDTQGHVSGGALYIHGASRADVKECEFISNASSPSAAHWPSET